MARKRKQVAGETVGTWLEPETAKELRAIAEHEDRSIASVIRRAIEQEIKRLKEAA